MRSHYLVAMIAILAQGCRAPTKPLACVPAKSEAVPAKSEAVPAKSGEGLPVKPDAVPAKPGAGASRTQPAPDQTYTQQMVGTWDFSFPDGETDMRIELRPDGHWRWWSPSRQPDPVAKVTIQSGTWFIHERTLVVRIEETAFGNISPGMAFTYDIASVSSETAVLIWLGGKREVKWTRVH